MAVTINAEADPKVKAEIDAQIAAFTVMRVYFLAESYRGIQKYAEAFALFERSSQYVSFSGPFCRSVFRFCCYCLVMLLYILNLMDEYSNVVQNPDYVMMHLTL